MTTVDNKRANLRVNRTNAGRRDAHRAAVERADNGYRNKRGPVIAIEKAIREGRIEPPKFGPI